MVLDEAAKIVQRQPMSDDDRLVILLASFCHDLGKPETTKYLEGNFVSHGHEEAGDTPTRSFLERLWIDLLTQEKVVKLVIYHLTLRFFYDAEFKRGQILKDWAIRRLALKLHPANIHELILVSEADHLGRGPFTPEEELTHTIPPREFPVGPWILERAANINVLAEKPQDLTHGKDWLQQWHTPGKLFGQLISISNSLRDEKGFSKQMVLEATEGICCTEEALQKLQSLLDS